MVIVSLCLCVLCSSALVPRIDVTHNVTPKYLFNNFTLSSYHWRKITCMLSMLLARSFVESTFVLYNVISSDSTLSCSMITCLNLWNFLPSDILLKKFNNTRTAGKCLTSIFPYFTLI